MSGARATNGRTASHSGPLDPESLLLGILNAPVVERIELPRQPERTASVPPAFLDNAEVARLLTSRRPDGKLWRHQAKGLEKVAEGRHVLMTTGTGSGKSLVFQAPLLRELLEGEGSAVVFYPQKALSSDQLRRWRRMLAEADLPESLVGEINGDTEMANREEIIASARILLTTPDLAHAWLARLQSAPAIRRFLGRMRFVVIDEAHAHDGVFGSNCAYFFRRLKLAVQRAREGEDRALQFIAASATIGNAAHHLEQLTGCTFDVIDEEDNGAPGQGMTLLHIEGPERGAASEAMLTEVARALAAGIDKESFVAFVDGRQAVERITRTLADNTILPYRSGYEAKDRHKIERALSAGRLRGCVATSALELGIDVAAFRFGFNLGVPVTRKSLRQRIGRVGRASSGAFAVVAPRNAFTRLGTTFEEFVSGEPEEGRLYLHNTAVQFQQACCLHNETGGASIEAIEWPAGFAEMRQYLEPGATLPPDLERIAQCVTDCPHIAFPLRQIGDTRMNIRLAGNRHVEVGTISLEKALREAFPGATYLHLRKAYKVVDWRFSAFERSILVKPLTGGPRTAPMLSARVQVPLDAASLLSEYVLESASGSLAERCLWITETVHGYSIGSKQCPYRELAKTDRRLRARHRQFESTGVIIRISEPWFAGSAAGKVETRKRVATALRAVLLAERGILPGEVSQTHTGISLLTVTGGVPLDDAIVIFDSMQGGLRLTEPLFSSFPGVIERLRRATDLAGEDTLLDAKIVQHLKDWYGSLSLAQSSPAVAVPGRIFAPGSDLGAFINGDMVLRRVTGHELMCIGGAEQLMYSYELDGGARGWVSHDSLRPVGSNWSYVTEGSSAGETLQ